MFNYEKATEKLCTEFNQDLKALYKVRTIAQLIDGIVAKHNLEVSFSCRSVWIRNQEWEKISKEVVAEISMVLDTVFTKRNPSSPEGSAYYVGKIDEVDIFINRVDVNCEFVKIGEETVPKYKVICPD